ncbi:hypothetical protein LT493_43945 [Streptomyces tricolor]|nr:hypothetical protein [Streptomyces tricolor]
MSEQDTSRAGGSPEAARRDSPPTRPCGPSLAERAGGRADPPAVIDADWLRAPVPGGRRGRRRRREPGPPRPRRGSASTSSPHCPEPARSSRSWSG